MLLYCRDSCRVGGKLDLDRASLRNFMLHLKIDQNLNVLLAYVEFVLRTYYLVFEIRNGTSQFEPAIISSYSVSNSF